jgi:hypothetical protein
MNKLLNNIKVTNAIASLVNSAIETGLNPAWYETDQRVNANGLLDASFEDCGLKTPSGKPARTDWSFRLRLNPDDLGEETEYTVITPELVITRLRSFVKDQKQPAWLQVKASGFLQQLDFIAEGNDKAAHELQCELDFDGVVDDALLQYIVALDIVFG